MSFILLGPPVQSNETQYSSSSSYSSFTKLIMFGLCQRAVELYVYYWGISCCGNDMF